MLTKEEIKSILPHREPFLFVERVLEMEKGRRILASRRFTQEDEFFKGHFPGHPVVPGAILAEAMAQACGILAYVSTGRTHKEYGAALLRLDKTCFRRLVTAGEEVLFEGIVKHHRGEVWKFNATAKVGSELCAESELMAMFTEKRR